MKALGIGIVIIVLAGLAWMALDRLYTCNPEVQALTDAQRRENLLMPKLDSAAHKEWVAKYGDSAEAWEMFTLTFHTKYLANVDKRLVAIEKKLADPNEEEPGPTNTNEAN